MTSYKFCRVSLGLAVLGIGLLAVSGCAKSRGTGTISGKITYKGQAVNSPIVHLHPSSGPASPYQVPVTPEGTFKIADMPLGDFKVTVKPTPPEPGMEKMPGFKPENAKGLSEEAIKGTKGTIPIPAKYAEVSTTDLTAKIDKNTKELNFELKD